MSDKLENLIQQYSQAVHRFDEVLKKPKDEFIRDSAIQRFEFTCELAWKTMKAMLETKGVKVWAAL